MATHSSVLAWRIPGTGEPGGLPSMGSHRVGDDCSDLAAAESWECVQHQGCHWSITCFIFCFGHCDRFYATRLQDQPLRMLGNCSDHAQEDKSSSWALLCGFETDRGDPEDHC